MPKPMWSNRAPPPSRSGGSNDSISDSAQPVFRSLTLPGDADLAHGTSNASLLNSSGGSAATLDLATGAAVGTGNARGSAAASCSTPTPTLPAVRMRSETGPLGEELRRKVLQGTEYQYEMRELLGRGSYAKVKLCRALETDATFAVKIFKVSLLKRRRMWDSQVVGFKTAFDDVLREIAIMKRLSHENVMNMHDVIDDASKEKLYMVMDYCPMGAIMETEKMPCAPLALDEARRLFGDTVVGLDYLHFQGVVHYDLKPDNILIAEDGRAVISDFGVSRVHPNKSDTTIGAPGTPTYTAPEVWGTGTYQARKSDVWSLGVTLHAMVFGCLPFYAPNQQDLIALVTDDKEWECAHECSDGNLLKLLAGMMRKVPADRLSLDDVKHEAWAADKIESRLIEWEKIEISESELRNAVRSGHANRFKRTPQGTLLKLTWHEEERMYRLMQDSACGAFLPRLHKSQPAKGKLPIILELQDLTYGLAQPCLMDVKMGLRNFSEADAQKTGRRLDMLEKMLKDAPDEPTEEEREKGVTKLRYLRFRDANTTTRELGFRVEAVQLSDDGADAPDVHELRQVRTREQVVIVVARYLQRRRELLISFLQQLRELRTTLEGDEVFRTHTFIRTSLLFVYDAQSNEVLIRLIDLPHTTEARAVGNDGQPGELLRLDHRIAWDEDPWNGNHEDGYLTGLDNIIAIFEELLKAAV